MKPHHSIDIWLCAAVVLLSCIGVGMVYSASMYMSMQESGSSSFYMLRQLSRLLVGFLAMAVITRLNYRGYLKLSPMLLVMGVILLISVLVKKIMAGDGVERWLDVGPVTIQPSEFMKIFLIIFLAASISGMGDRIKSFKGGFVPLLAIIGTVVGLVLLEPDLGISGLMLVTGLYMLYVGRARFAHLMLVLLPAAIGLVLVVNTVTYMKMRWLSYIHPEQYPQVSYHVLQSKISIGSGGILGLGLGNSTQKFLFLPESHTDFVFSIMAEELGFVRISIVLALMLFIVIRGFKIAREAPDTFGFLLASGISFMLGMQMFINIGVATGLLPTTGMTLPFISYGGSSLIVTLCATGILLNISRQGSYERRLSQEFGIRLHRRAMA